VSLVIRSETICQAHHWHYLTFHFVSQLSEASAAMVPIAERGWMSRLFRLNRNEDILDTFDHRLNEAQQRFMVCQQHFVIDSASLIMIVVLKVGIITQIRGEVSQFQKHTSNSLVCPLSYDYFTDPFISACRIR
jgi:hypothetical protein